MSDRMIHRSGLYIIHSQLEGACIGLRATVSAGLPIGAGSVAVIKKLHDDFRSLSTGRSLEDLPEINEQLTPVDLLVVAETLRMTVLTFLTPDELDEKKAAQFGFAPKK